MGRMTCLPCIEAVLLHHGLLDIVQGLVLGLVELDYLVLVDRPGFRHLGVCFVPFLAASGGMLMSLKGGFWQLDLYGLPTRGPDQMRIGK